MNLVSPRAFAWAAGWLLGVSSITALLALTQPLDHDEHQFVASGALLATQGLLPYRDYPYFHMPDLALAYGLLFQLTTWHLTAARLFSALCASCMLLVLGATALRVLAGSERRRLALAIVAVVLVLANPLFLYTSGLAWNHDASTLCALSALLALARGLTSGPSWRWVLASGILLGLAIGVRLSFAVLVAAFLGATLTTPYPLAATRWQLALVFVAGLALALSPSLALCLNSPAQFAFGNVTYASLNTVYRLHTGYLLAMNPLAKLDYVVRQVLAQPANAVLAASFVAVVASGFRRPPARASEAGVGLWLAIGSLPLLVVGALAPTPSFPQYFYPLVPFAVLGIVYALATVDDWGTAGRSSLGLLGLAVSVSVASAIPRARIDLSPGKWSPVAAHMLGIEVTHLVSGGRVLTLAPLVPEEGGSPIYPQFATGPFVWRIAPEMTAEQRQQNGVIGLSELETLWQAEPPAGVLVGFETDLEPSFITFARAYGYSETTVREASLWVRPIAGAGQRDRLD